MKLREESTATMNDHHAPLSDSSCAEGVSAFRKVAGEDGQYKVQNTTFGDPKNKKLRLACIGAGVSGIMMAYKIQKYMENYELVIYEREEEIGGTWWLNRYPGAACDIPSHAYTYNFALNPDWPSFFSPSANIWSYLNRVCSTFGLRRFMQFRSETTKAEWQQTSATWKIWINITSPDGTVTEKIDECDVLLHATGVLNKFKWPDIKGIEEFQGKLIHTARWPDEYQQHAWKDETVAVIGSGASSVQTVPNMQPHVKHLSVFIRTPIWFVELAGNNGKNIEYSADERRRFRENPEELVKFAKNLEDQINAGWPMMEKDSEMQNMVQAFIIQRTKNMIKDEKLAEKVIPKWSVGCRRVTPGDPYMIAIQEDNVTCHFEDVVEITETTIKGKNGAEEEVDTIVCATGFDTSFRPDFPIIGRSGVDLREKWKDTPEAYLGVAVPDMPNFFTFIGPTWPIGNGSVMGPLEAVGDYVIKFLHKMQNELIRTFAPIQGITDLFNEHAQEYLKATVWADDCRAWYKNNKTGRINAIWPGSSLHYIEVIANPRYEDFEWDYERTGGLAKQFGAGNMWRFLGNGRTTAFDVDGSDKSPYMDINHVDEKWLEVMKQEFCGDGKLPGRKIHDNMAPNEGARARAGKEKADKARAPKAEQLSGITSDEVGQTKFGTVGSVEALSNGNNGTNGIADGFDKL